MATEADVARQVGKLAKLYGREMTPDVIAFFVEILIGALSADEACEAIALWAKRETRWPAPAQIIALVRPIAEARDEAAELAQRLRAAISRRGYTWESTYRYDGYDSIDEAILIELGDDALALVHRHGGWAAFCREWGGEDGDTSARAQLRGLCEATLKHAGQRPALGPAKQRTQGLEHIGAILGLPNTKPGPAT